MALTTEQLAHAVALARYQEEIERDPLAQFSFTNFENGRTHETQIAFVQHAIGLIETYLRASNQNGKTHVGAALTIALIRGDPQLGDLPLPLIEQPAVGWVLCQSWQGMVDGAGSKLRELLGKWPHRIAWINAGLGYIGTIYIKYRGCKSDDWRDWARLTFHVEGQGIEQRSLPGARIDLVWADEPPNMKRWRECRARGKRNKPFFRYITATPLDRQRWEELRADFADSVGHVNHGKIELVADLHENPFLSDAHIAQILESWSTDPQYLARAHGEYVDLEGTSPFQQQYSVLQELNERCVAPQWRTATVRVRVETDYGRVINQKLIRYEWWHPPTGDEHYGVLDTSLGIQDADGIHDPGCCHIYNRRTRQLVARFNGYEASYNLGSIAAAMGRQYNEADLDVETNGGYGDGALDALADCGYTHYAQESERETMGKMAKGRLGFRTTEINKPKYITQIQNMLEEGGLEILSSAVIGCLMAAKLDEYGRLYKPRGVKYEDLICLGRFLLWESLNPVPALAPAPVRRFPEILAETMGRQTIPATQRKSLDRWAR